MLPSSVVRENKGGLEPLEASVNPDSHLYFLHLRAFVQDQKVYLCGSYFQNILLLPSRSTYSIQKKYTFTK